MLILNMLLTIRGGTAFVNGEKSQDAGDIIPAAVRCTDLPVRLRRRRDS